MKKSAVAAVCLLVCTGMLAGFQGEKESPLTQIDVSVPIQPGARIAVVSKNTKGQFWNLVKAGMQDALTAVNEAYSFDKNEQIRMTFEGSDDETKVEDQINTIDAVLDENPDVLCLSVGDSNSCVAQIEAAAENGIPVVVFDSNVNDSGLATAFRGTDNFRVGELAAKELAEAVSEGTIAVFSIQGKTQSIQAREEGFRTQMEEYPDIRVLDPVYQDEEENMTASMTEILENTPGLKGVFCSNADIAELYLGLGAELRNGILMVGVDATTKQQEALKSGDELCVVSQDPKTMGYETILTAVMATAPDSLNTGLVQEILLPPQVINAENMYNPLFSNYIYTD